MRVKDLPLAGTVKLADSWEMRFCITFRGRNRNTVSIGARNIATGERLIFPGDATRLAELWPMDDWPEFARPQLNTETETQYRQEGLF